MRPLPVRVALITGLPLAVPAGLFVSQGRILDFLTTTLLALIIVGAPQGLLAGWATGLHRQGGRFAVGTLALLLAPVMATLAMLATGELPHGRWVRLPMPPSPLTALAGPDCAYPTQDAAVYGTGRDGRLYRFPDSGPVRTEWKQRWGLADSIPPASEESLCQRRFHRAPAAPARVVSRLRVRGIGADCTRESRFVLLKTGEVWTTARGTCSIGLFMSWLLGCALTFILAATAWISGLATGRREPRAAPSA